MARLKAIVRSALEDRSPRFLLATVALGVVVALVAGFAIGYKVDDSNGNGGGGGRRAATGNGKGNKGSHAAAVKGAPLLIGSVNSLNARKVVVLNGKGNARPLGLGRKTRIHVTGDAKSADNKVGTHVLFPTRSAGATPPSTNA